jgi:hypothetical protein
VWAQPADKLQRPAPPPDTKQWIAPGGGANEYYIYMYTSFCFLEIKTLKHIKY